MKNKEQAIKYKHHTGSGVKTIANRIIMKFINYLTIKQLNNEY
jgi:hypothetical protein